MSDNASVLTPFEPGLTPYESCETPRGLPGFRIPSFRIVPSGRVSVYATMMNIPLGFRLAAFVVKGSQGQAGSCKACASYTPKVLTALLDWQRVICAVLIVAYA